MTTLMVEISFSPLSTQTFAWCSLSNRSVIIPIPSRGKYLTDLLTNSPTSQSYSLQKQDHVSWPIFAPQVSNKQSGLQLDGICWASCRTGKPVLHVNSLPTVAMNLKRWVPWYTSWRIGWVGEGFRRSEEDLLSLWFGSSMWFICRRITSTRDLW